jgi:two-component system, NarL family, nitrate/nitrite response regulator NarL
MEPLRLLIADDHPLFLMGIKYTLSAQGFLVVAEATNGEEAVAACFRHQPEIILMDIKMPKLDGIEACRQMVAKYSSLIVIMLTTFEEPGVIQAAKQAGAKGYVSKETPPLELATLIQKIAKNPEKDWFPKITLPALTQREEDVLGLLVQGLSNKDIAKALQLSPETIKDYLERIYAKLGVSDRVAAIHKAQSLSLVRLTSNKNSVK